MKVSVVSRDPDSPYKIKVKGVKKPKLIPILVTIIIAELIFGGVVVWQTFIYRPNSSPNSPTWEEGTELISEKPAEEDTTLAEPKTPETPKEPELKSVTELKSPSEITINALATEPKLKYAANIDEAFAELRDYVVSLGLDISFGYANLNTGYTYKYRGDRVYYGASLVKTLDAMYAYEKLGSFSQSTRDNITRAATYSKNDAHAALVDEFGIDNLRNYAKEIGMTRHLTPSSIYPDTYYFCDTTVDDQLIEWRHLWRLINTLPSGWELGEYFRVGWWGILQFPGHPQFMFKAGMYGPYYHETGIFLAGSPYIFTLLTTNGYRADKDNIMSALSRKVYEINERYQ